MKTVFEKRLSQFLIFGFVLTATFVPLKFGFAQTTGPENGTLVVVGGGDRKFTVFRKFVELAGGEDARLVVITTAASSSPKHDFTKDYAAAFARRRLGLKTVTIVHTHDRDEADQDSFVKPIREADAVWFSGGRQWRLVDAYAGTKTEVEFNKVLERGGVIGGSSAGATIQGSFLVRGDTSGNQILIGDHQKGFCYIKNCAIDQHVIPRGRENDMFEVLSDPEGKMDKSIDRSALLGLGIDEATGIIVRKNEFEVVGKKDGVVLVYDPTCWEDGEEKAYSRLTIGQHYNLRDREIIAEPEKLEKSVASPD